MNEENKVISQSKIIIIAICVIAIIAAVGIGAYAAGRQSQSGGAVTKAISAHHASLDEAKEIARNDAGVASEDITVKKAVKDYENGIEVYDIEFYTDDMEYEYEIAIETAEIISKDTEKKVSTTSTPSNKQSETEVSKDATDASGKYIGIDKAKEVALKDAGIDAGEASFTKAKLEREDGIMAYEIEFVSGNTEYDYEIDATSGSIRDRDIEPVDYDD